MPVRLLLPRRFYDEMIAQARAELPNECCGLLAGRMDEHAHPGAQATHWRVSQRYPLVNKVASPVEYFAEERGLFAAHRDMWKQGLDLLAVYHSHPTSAPVPSRKDRERNYLGEIVFLIISLQSDEPEVKAWWLAENESREADWICVADGRVAAT
jgi:proteasome lid subunit RPN8/RPN11